MRPCKFESGMLLQQKANVCSIDGLWVAVTLILETWKMSHIMAKYLVKCHLLYLEGGPHTWRAPIERNFGKQDISGPQLLSIFAKRWACRRIEWFARINKREPVQKLVSWEWTKPTTVSKPKQWGRLDYSVIHCPSPKRICFSGAPTLGLATWLALANHKWGAVYICHFWTSVWLLPLLFSIYHETTVDS